MRLDKFLSETGTASRTESKKAARAGGITVNGMTVKDPSQHIDPEKDTVVYMGTPVLYQKFIYLMLNKPDGVLSATEDGEGKTVLDLVPEKYRKMGLFPCGRLDKNTLGLLILTNNGPLAHKLLSPKCHVKKTYRFECERPLTDADCDLLCRGVDIGEKSSTQPAKLNLFSDRSGEITVTEGKFHQIKRMLAQRGKPVVYLERIAMGNLPLDPALERGKFRFLTAKEVELLQKA